MISKNLIKFFHARIYLEKGDPGLWVEPTEPTSRHISILVAPSLAGGTLKGHLKTYKEQQIHLGLLE
jgi:hypothetical protein